MSRAADWYILNPHTYTLFGEEFLAAPLPSPSPSPRIRRRGRMAPQLLEVCVPDGIAAGEEFIIEFAGLSLSVNCPAGCGAGDTIQIEVDAPESAETQQQQVEVVIPEGCFPGSEFAVTFGENEFCIAVPDGCEPGMAILVDVPSECANDGHDGRAAGRLTKSSGGADLNGDADAEARRLQEMQDAEMARKLQAEEDEMGRQMHESQDADLARRIQGDEVRASANAAGACSSSSGAGDWTSTADEPPTNGWGPVWGDDPTSSVSQQPQSTSLFSTPVGTEDGTYGRKAGDFMIGQLVQVNRSDGSWTYGKVMAYDEGGDTYSVMTRAGPKHFVERADLTDDVVINPSDGSCAQQ